MKLHKIICLYVNQLAGNNLNFFIFAIIIKLQNLNLIFLFYRHSFLYQKLLSILKRHVIHEKKTVSPIMELLSLPSKLL